MPERNPTGTKEEKKRKRIKVNVVFRLRGQEACLLAFFSEGNKDFFAGRWIPLVEIVIA